MSHPITTEGVELHEPEVADRTYLKVFLALLIFTVLEYFYARFTQDHFLALLLGLTALAVTKAALVAIFFMHLKFEGGWVYLLLVPATLLAVALVLALYPDIASHPDQTRPAPTLARPQLHVTARISEQNAAIRTEDAAERSRSNRDRHLS